MPALQTLMSGFLAVLPLGGWAAEPTTDQEKAVAAIEALQGKVVIDEKSPGKPVISVEIRNIEANDAILAHLKGLTELQTLVLRAPQVGDGGLVHLPKLTHLRELSLDGTHVTNAGLRRLKGLTQLNDLSLRSTEITDAGLRSSRQ